MLGIAPNPLHGAWAAVPSDQLGIGLNRDYVTSLPRVKNQEALPKTNYLLPNVLLSAYPGSPDAQEAKRMHTSLIADEGITHAVCLMQKEELAGKTGKRPFALYEGSLRKIASEKGRPFEYHNDVAIPDVCIIQDKELDQFVNSLVSLAENPANKLLIHCHGGNGRTSTVATILFSRLKKCSFEEAMEHVFRAYLTRLDPLRPYLPESNDQFEQIKKLCHRPDGKDASKLTFEAWRARCREIVSEVRPDLFVAQEENLDRGIQGALKKKPLATLPPFADKLASAQVEKKVTIAAAAAIEPSLGRITLKNLPEYMQLIVTNHTAKPYPPKNKLVVTHNKEVRNWVDLTAEEKYQVVYSHALPHAKKNILPKNVFSTEQKWVEHIEGQLFQVSHTIDGLPKIPEGLENDSREAHGSDHAMLVAIFTVNFEYLYEKYLNAKATEQDLLMMLLTGAFHDSGRQAEGIDIDDARSAANAFKDLTAWGVAEKEAATCRDAIIGKDDKDFAKKNLLAKCVQCADSMAYARLGNWNKKHLDIHNEMQALQDKEKVKEFAKELEVLSDEMTKLIFIVSFDKRKEFSQPGKNYFSEILKLITPNDYPETYKILKAKKIIT